MIPQLAGALSQGFTSKQVIDYLIRKFPDHADKIKAAMSAGFTADQIIKFLGGGRKAVVQESPAMTEHEQTRQTDIQRREAVNQKALQAGALAAGAIATPFAANALSKAVPMAATALERALPNSLKPMIPALTGQPQVLPQQPLTSEPPSGQVPTTVAQVPTPIQPEVKTINVEEVLNKHALKKHVDELAKKQKDPKAVAAILYSKFPAEMKAFQKEAGKNMEDAIADYLQSKPEMAKETPVAEAEAPKIEKGATVASPEGLGEVKAIRNGQAIIDVDGKQIKVSEDELHPSPLPKKDLADLYDDMIRGIEEESGADVSRMVQWAGYNPETNVLKFLPHDGDLYEYEDISKEDADLLTSILSTRKTSGKNFIGPWIAGSKSPIGAAMSKLIKRLQEERGGKGKEYSEKTTTVYSAYEPGVKASKKKKRKKPS